MSNRLRALALAGTFALAATLALALPAAADPPSALHPAPGPGAQAPAAPAPATGNHNCIGMFCLPGNTPSGEAPTGPDAPCGVDPVTGTACSLGRIADMMGAIHAFASNPVGAFGSFVANTLTGGDPAFAGQLLMGTPDFTTHNMGKIDDNAFHYLNKGFLAAALVILGIALVLRVIKQSVEEGGRGAGSALNVLIDIGPRLVIFPAMALVSFEVISGLAVVSAQIGAQLFAVFATAAGGEVAGMSIYDGVMHVLSSAFTFQGFALIGIAGLALACMLLYIVMLSAMRFVMLAFMVVIAPVAIMCGAYDTKNQVFQWWLSTTFGALLIPPIVGAIGGITVVMVTPATLAGPKVSLAAPVFMIGGLWFMGKAIHHATLGAFQGKHFSGMLAAAEVGMFAWTRPLGWHKSMASAVPGLAAASRGGGGGGGGDSSGSRALQSATGAIGGGSAGEGGRDTAAEAAATLAPKAPFRRAFETAVSNGVLKDEVASVAAAGGMGNEPLNDQTGYYLEQPYNAEKVYLGMHTEHRTSAGGFINPSDPKNTTEAINANFAVHHPELYGGGGAALPAAEQIRPAPIVGEPLVNFRPPRPAAEPLVNFRPPIESIPTAE